MDSSSDAHSSDSNEPDEHIFAENIETAEDEIVPEKQVYTIFPSLEDKFKPLDAKEVINNILFDYLSTKEYDAEEAPNWSQDIAKSIREKMKNLDFKKYKFAVNVVIGNRNGAGVKIGTRCIWDAEADGYAHGNFTNDTIFCVAVVYAVYTY